MTSRERITAALSGKTPDRVPVMEMAIDWKVVRGLGCRDLFELVDTLELDAVPVNQLLYTFGSGRFLKKFVKTYRDEWGTQRKFTDELLPIPYEYPIAKLEDLRAYRPPKPRDSSVLKAIRFAKKRCGDKPLVIISRADFAACWYLSGMDNLLVKYIEQPEFGHELLKIVSDYYVEFLPLAVKAGADIVILTDDYAHKTGGLFSPTQFETYVLPGLTRAVHAVKDAGGFCIKHTDGNIWEIIDAIALTGVDGIGPLEPGAGMDLGDVKAKLGDSMCVMGNVDVDLLSRGTPAEVAEATRLLMSEVASKGGHILSSGNTLSSSVNPDNYRVMVETAREVI